MAKAVITLGYHEYIMDAQEALKIMDVLAGAERYRQQYRSRDEGGPLHYVWSQTEDQDIQQLRIIPDDLYRIAKLAGKPEA